MNLKEFREISKDWPDDAKLCFKDETSQFGVTVLTKPEQCKLIFGEEENPTGEIELVRFEQVKTN